MPVFAVHYSYVDDAAVVTEHRPAHREFLRDLLNQGIVLAAGAYTDGPAGALLVFRGDSEGDIARLLERDPFQQLGWCRTVRSGPGARPWGPGRGKAARCGPVGCTAS